MTTFKSHDALLKELRALIDRWCDRRKLEALSLILPGYLALNGLTDGWAALSSALKSTRALGHEALDPADWDALNDLIRTTDDIVHRR